MAAIHVEYAGEHGPRLILVHGSLAPGWGTFEGQRQLAERYRLVVPHRPGYPPNPASDRIDFDSQADVIAELIEPGTHLIGHSYGGVISMLAAARAGDRVATLTLSEPPAFGVARGDPAVEAFIAERGGIANQEEEPRDFLVRFVAAVGSSFVPPDPMPPSLEAAVRATMAEPQPWEAEISLAALQALRIPVLVISGGHHVAFDAVCDVIERELDAERAVLTGAAHSIPRLGAAYNERLSAFVDAHQPR